MSVREEAALALAADQAHHLERVLLTTRIERLCAVIREHGIPLPEEDPRLGASDGEHLAASRRVVTAAYGLLEGIEEFERALAELRSLVGSGMELVGKESWRAKVECER